MKRILVVDDSRMMLMFEEMCLRGTYEVSTAASAREALAKAVAERPDLVLTDLNLPDLSGSEIADALRQDARTSSIKVIVATTASGMSQLAPPVAFLEKPFSRESLLAKVATSLD